MRPRADRSQLVAAKAGSAFAAPAWVPCSQDHDAGRGKAEDARHDRPQHPHHAARGDRARRRLGGGRRLEPRPRRCRLLRHRRSRRLPDRRARRRAGRHHLLRQLRRALRLPRLLHRAAGPARPGPRPAASGTRPSRTRARASSASTASWRSRRTTGSRASSSPTPMSATAAPSPRRPRRAPTSSPLSDVPFAAVEADDATVFPAPRPRVPARLDRRPRTHRPRAGARRPARRLGRDPALPHRPQDRPARRRRPRGRRDRALRPACSGRRRRGLPRRPRAQPRRDRAGAKASASPPCSRPRACTPAPSRRCGSIASSASPPSSWAEG